MDEKKIPDNLVWDKHSGEVIAYVDLGGVNVNYAILSKVEEIANLVLVFLIQSIANILKFSLADFAKTGASVTQMFHVLWKAISICEINMLNVLTRKCDGASPIESYSRCIFM